MQYKGLNRIHLMYASTDFNESRWLTFKQTQQMKSKGRKESIGKQILFFDDKEVKIAKEKYDQICENKNLTKYVNLFGFLLYYLFPLVLLYPLL